MLVWQDMPSGDDKPAENRAALRAELEHVVDALQQLPVDRHVGAVQRRLGPARHREVRRVAEAARPDAGSSTTRAAGPTRASATCRTCTRIRARRCRRSKRSAPRCSASSAASGLPLEGHTWIDKGNWGYRSFTDADELGAGLSRPACISCGIMVGQGLSAAIYTQTTDVEIEVNGLMTYDRAVVKLPPDAMAPPCRARLAAGRPRRRARIGSRRPAVALHDHRARRRPGSTAAFDDGAMAERHRRIRQA